MSDIDGFKFFMNAFVHGHLAKPTDEKLPPFRLVEYEVSCKEIQGHSFGWAADYLLAHKCPVHWANVICAEVIKRVADADLTDYKLVRDSTGEGETYYDAQKLCQLTFRTVEEIVSHWLDDFPSQHSHCCSSHRHKISYYAMKNTRRKMEDRYSMVPLMHLFTDVQEYKDSSLYTVFDGHGGCDASSYAAAHFLFNLVTQPAKDKMEALTSTFAQTDADFCVRATKERLRSGTTGVVVLSDPEAIYVSWLGDSQALLVKDGRAIEVMTAHKPECESERSRIVALGGSVVWIGTWRVNGNLAVSRAIGDIEHKPYVCSDSECHKLAIDEQDEYLIVACDGLWDTVSFDTAVKLVYDHIQSGKPQQTVAETLARAAKDEGSSDNITVIVVFLKSDLSPPVPTKLPAEDTANVESDEAETAGGVKEEEVH